MATEVLIAGAGPTGLTAAVELSRRGIPVRIVDRAGEFAIGSRGDGLQPRTLEVFEDLGILDEVFASGIGEPLTRVYRGDQVVWEGRMSQPVQPRPDVPYPNTWFVPQWRTEQILRSRLSEEGIEVQLGSGVASFEQDTDGVTALLDGGETVRSSYLIGADGGRSMVRRRLDVPFVGGTDDEFRMLLADVRADGLDHDTGHGWMLDDTTFFGFTPLADGSDSYVIATPAPDLEPTLDSLQCMVDRVSGRSDIRLRELTWATVWRPNVRMAERFRTGRVLLAGDAAHVHPPTGGQGLNTGVQDAYNLGWKLAAVLGGAPDARSWTVTRPNAFRSPRTYSESAASCWTGMSAAPRMRWSAARRLSNSTSTTGPGHLPSTTVRAPHWPPATGRRTRRTCVTTTQHGCSSCTPGPTGRYCGSDHGHHGSTTRPSSPTMSAAKSSTSMTTSNGPTAPHPAPPSSCVPMATSVPSQPGPTPWQPTPTRSWPAEVPIPPTTSTNGWAWRRRRRARRCTCWGARGAERGRWRLYAVAREHSTGGSA
jgi:2-polyprenyl-6-methoxyphenol hydroxylase-like FAD-dependent oxidoreductase